MMLFPLLALAQSAAAVPAPAVYDGECIYPPALGEPRGGEVRVLCNRVAVDEWGIDFVDRAWDRRMLRFAGEWDGNLLKVRTVTPRSGATVEVRGVCRIDFANGATSVIACTAVAGGRSWVGNFRVSRL